MWTFFSDTGVTLNPAGAQVGLSYSGGNKGENPEGVNNPALQNVKDVGPLPVGMYTVGEFADDPIVGKFAAHLTPDPENKMYGRADFMWHGDNRLMNQSASEGCIVSPRYIRFLVATSGDNRLKVATTPES